VIHWKESLSETTTSDKSDFARCFSMSIIEKRTKYLSFLRETLSPFDKKPYSDLSFPHYPREGLSHKIGTERVIWRISLSEAPLLNNVLYVHFIALLASSLNCTQLPMFC